MANNYPDSTMKNSSPSSPFMLNKIKKNYFWKNCIKKNTWEIRTSFALKVFTLKASTIYNFSKGSKFYNTSTFEINS